MLLWYAKYRLGYAVYQNGQTEADDRNSHLCGIFVCVSSLYKLFASLFKCNIIVPIKIDRGAIAISNQWRGHPEKLMKGKIAETL